MKTVYQNKVFRMFPLPSFVKRFIKLAIQFKGLRFPPPPPPFQYRGRWFRLFEHECNCGWRDGLMTERAVELSIADWWLKRHAREGVVEVGAVTPYYWRNRVKTVIDPSDRHSAVTHRTSLFNFDFAGRTVLSISTVEHVGAGEYGLEALRTEDCTAALRLFVEQSKSCLITFPTGYAPALDAFVMSPEFKALQEALSLNVTVYKRNASSNHFELYMGNDISSIPFGVNGIRIANGVVIIEK